MKLTGPTGLLGLANHLGSLCLPGVLFMTLLLVDMLATQYGEETKGGLLMNGVLGGLKVISEICVHLEAELLLPA